MPNKVFAHILLLLYLMIDNFHNTIIPYDGKNAGISIWNGQNISIHELLSFFFFFFFFLLTFYLQLVNSRL